MIDKEEAVRKGYKEKHHIDTYTTPTTSEITFIQEHNITSGHFVDFDKLAERNVPKLNALKQSDFTISNIDYSKSEKGKNGKYVYPSIQTGSLKKIPRHSFVR